MIFVVVSFGIYFLLLVLLIAGWQRAEKQPAPETGTLANKKITVIVPFRNEAENLAGVIGDLQRQKYPPTLYEVVLCNDHSTDESASLAESAISRTPNFRVIHSRGDGKKQALAYAIESASGEIVATTDADCRLPENWTAAIAGAFADPSVNMVFGAVSIAPENTFFSTLQALEFSSLIGSGAATASYGFPTLSNGANLAFRRSVFFDVEGYKGNSDILSGDDEFLMRKIHRRFPGSVHFLNAAEALVFTRPQDSLRTFFSQRLRWAAKWRYNPSPGTVALALFIWTFQSTVALLFVIVPVVRRDVRTILSLLAVKFLLEYIFLSRTTKFLRVRWNWIAFLALQVLYPFYVLTVGLASNGIAYSWKQRSARRGKPSSS
jgi:biofilm PGA synthesis N-glycosyltransferase PgaC